MFIHYLTRTERNGQENGYDQTGSDPGGFRGDHQRTRDSEQFRGVDRRTGRRFGGLSVPSLSGEGRSDQRPARRCAQDDHDRIYALADETNDIRKIVRGIVEFIIESAATNRPKHKFLIMLLNDFSVEINPDIRERIRSIGDTLIAVGRKIMFCVTIHPLKICILHWSESPCSTLLRGISSVSGTRPAISGD